MLRLADDDRLARLAAAGSDQAFGVLYRRHEARLLTHCRCIVGNDDEARDALQNAMIKALGALRGGQLRGAPRPWLVAIARNESVSLLRARHVHAPLDAVEPAARGDARGPEETVLVRERFASLAEDLGELPERQRRALLLREGGDLSYEEIGGILAMGPGAARQAVSEAREALRADAAGRESACAPIRSILEQTDRRRHRARHVRSHLRGCASCRDWQQANRPRPRGLALGSLLGVKAASWGWILEPLAFGGSGGGMTAGVRASALAATIAAGSLFAAPAVHRRERAAQAPKPVAAAPTSATRTAAAARAAALGPGAAAAARTSAGGGAATPAKAAGQHRAGTRTAADTDAAEAPAERETRYTGAGRGDDERRAGQGAGSGRDDARAQPLAERSVEPLSGRGRAAAADPPPTGDSQPAGTQQPARQSAQRAPRPSDSGSGSGSTTGSTPAQTTTPAPTTTTPSTTNTDTTTPSPATDATAAVAEASPDAEAEQSTPVG